MNGSGTLDALAAGTLGLAAFVTKTVTLHPRDGNPPQRIAETPAGMVNSIGLANPGLDRFCADYLPRLAELGVPLIVSVGGWSREEYATAVARITAPARRGRARAQRLLPNVDTGCISIGTDAAETRALVERCRAVTDLPLLVKLSPSVADVAAIADGRRGGRRAGLVLINTVRGMAIDPAHAAADSGRRRGRAVRAGGQAGRRCMPCTTAARDRAADRRHGRCRVASRTARVRWPPAPPRWMWAPRSSAIPACPAGSSPNCPRARRARRLGSVTDLVGSGPPATSQALPKL